MIYERSKRKRVSGRRKRAKEIANKPYRDWCALQPCAVCEALGRSQVSCSEHAHVGDRGFGQKCPDREGIPLCAEHHRLGPESQHGGLGRKFWTHHGVDRGDLVKHYNRLFDEEQTSGFRADGSI